MTATLLYAFLSGLNDSSGLVAAAISTRALAPRIALFSAAVAVFVGFFLFGTAVASTIGKELVQPDAITLDVLLISISSAIIWVFAATYFGIPSSSTHALLGGLVGAVTVLHGYQALMLFGFVKVLLALLGAPILGAAGGYLVMHLIKYGTRDASPRINLFFKGSQPFDVIALALSYGANDGQKSVALMTMALVAAGYQSNFSVRPWVTLTCAATLAAGIAIGGQRTIRTVGGRIYRLRPVHAFAAQSSAAAIVLTAALLGGPVSTPQVTSTSIIGVGSAERMSAVRWQVAGQIVVAWIVTIPATALMAAIMSGLVNAWIGL